LRHFSFPAPRGIFGPILLVFLSVRAVYYFVLRVLVCEPLFKAYCETYGRNVHTGTYLHWVQGKGAITLGDNVLIDGKCSFTFAARFVARPALTIGSNTGIGHGCRFVVGKSITIGSHCGIAGGTLIFDSNGHPVDARRRARGEAPREEDVLPIVIHDHVWIGRNVIIGPGVTVGEGAVVSAGSVVMTDVAPYTVVCGNPAGKIGETRPRTPPPGRGLPKET
jgi:acetyltransferase-like isoleucine patch superfamily enzyme